MLSPAADPMPLPPTMLPAGLRSMRRMPCPPSSKLSVRHSGSYVVAIASSPSLSPSPQWQASRPLTPRPTQAGLLRLSLDLTISSLFHLPTQRRRALQATMGPAPRRSASAVAQGL